MTISGPLAIIASFIVISVILGLLLVTYLRESKMAIHLPDFAKELCINALISATLVNTVVIAGLGITQAPTLCMVNLLLVVSCCLHGAGRVLSKSFC